MQKKWGTSTNDTELLLQKRVKAGFASYLTFIVLTCLNLVIVMFEIGFTFPFSAVIPELPLRFGQSYYQEEGAIWAYVIGFLLALILASIYLLLYFLSKKKMLAIYITIGLVMLDTLILILLSFVDLVGVLVDLLFHAWVIFALVGLLQSKFKLDLLEKNVKTEKTKRW